MISLTTVVGLISASLHLTTAYSTDQLDNAILTDILQQYTTYAPSPESICPSSASTTTTFTHDWPGTNPDSKWDTATVSNFEEGLFQTLMTHTDVNTNTSWSIRVGTNGNIYSHYTPDLWGETMAPQAHTDAPWIDEVHQSVAVNGYLSGQCYDVTGNVLYDNNGNPIKDPEAAGVDVCKKHFLHQAGAYQWDGIYTDVPFFSPSLAKSCEGNTCMFASWGTSAHVDPTPFTSSLITINMYTNCGNGVIEHTQMMYNFAPHSAPALDVDLTYFNAAWTGVRSSHLPWALEPNPQTGLFNYQDPADVDHLELKPWGNDGPTPSPPGYTCAPLSSERTDLRNLWGYTTFATNDLIVKQPELTKWCRKPEGCAVDNFPTDGCMVPTCRCPNSDQVWEGYTEIDLKVPANSRPDCAYHTGWQGKVSLECNLRDETGFGKTTPYMNGGSGSGLKFVNSLTGEGIQVAFVRHWSWSTRNKRVYFAVYYDDDGKDGPNTQAAITEVNSIFDNRGNPNPLPVEFRLNTEVADVAPPNYDPNAIPSFTYVYGQGEEYTNNDVDGVGRRRIGSSARDYNVFTINWWFGSKLEPGESYSTRQYLVSSDLGSVKAIADPLRDQVVIEEHNENEYTPRNVDLYQLGSRFAAVAASSSSSTTSCGDASASLVCTGKTTPSAGYLPWFFITCGSSTFFGQDPYHFTPFSGTEFQFPGHSTPNYPVRSYVCDGQPISIRPSWKLVGFFNDSCASLATSTYDETVCPWDESWTEMPSDSPSLEPSTSIPTSSPSKDPSQSPSSGPTSSPTTSNPSVSPSGSPSKEPTISPSLSPSRAPSKAPSKEPTLSPSLSPSKSPSNMPSVSPSKGPSQEPSASPTTTPSTSPSKEPTNSPSLSPSRAPSKSPTKEPTTSPSLSPSRSPSNMPSVSPSKGPSQSPSANPKTAPSVSPSTSPSTVPTESPSNNPTSSPSKSIQAFDDNAPTPHSTPVIVDVLANDVYAVEMEANLIVIANGADRALVSSQSTHGACVVVGNQVQYTPSLGYDGQDSCQYEVCDSVSGSCDTAMVHVEVGTPSVPVANDDEVGTLVDTPVTSDVLGNDTQEESLTLDIRNILTQAIDGICSVVDNEVQYTPDAGFVGSDSCVYTVCVTGSITACSTATLSIDVSAAPTSNPSQTPSLSPSKGPSQQPSTVPTGSPSKEPTSSPSLSPSGSPSNSPSANPTTAEPSTSPSDSPSTSHPTLSPSEKPSTADPTASPSDNPSLNPTEEATLAISQYYTACGSSVNVCKGQSEKADIEELHEVRCCTESLVNITGGDNWNKRSGCDVWGESHINGVCHAQKTHDEAVDICSSVGARLCTKDELENDCPRGTGCNFDREMNWSSTPVPPCNSDESCDDGKSCTIDTCGEDGRCVSDTVPGCTKSIVCGSSAASACRDNPVIEASPNELHEVRCCSNVSLPGWRQHNNCNFDVWAESDPEGVCHASKTYAEAEELCVSFGGRLCTKEEILSDCTRGTGCSFDKEYIWSSSPFVEAPFV